MQRFMTGNVPNVGAKWGGIAGDLGDVGGLWI